MEDISVPLVRRDGPAKVSGRATYVADLGFAGVLHAKTVRAAVPAGKIAAIELPAHGADVSFVGAADIPGENAVSIIGRDMPVFAAGEVRYVGEPILLVCGPDRETVQRAAEAVRVVIVPQEPVFGWTDAIVRHRYAKGDPDAAFARAKNVVTETFETGYQEQAYLETQGIAGYPEADGTIVLVGSMQCPYYIKNAVVPVLDCAPDKVRVIQAETGGAFGGKEEYPSLLGAQVAVAVRKTGKPVRLILDRPEDVEATTKRHPARITLSAALDADDRIIGLRASVGMDAGAYLGLSGVVLSRALIAATGAYTIPNLAVDGAAYRTNTVPTGAFRGFGSPQMFFAIETFMNHLARATGSDPVAFRRRHLARRGDATSTSGTFRDPILADAMIDRVLNLSDYRRKTREFARSDAWKGIGLAVFFHGCGFTGDGEAVHIKARVRLEKDPKGVVTIRIAATDMGQGAATALPKIVAKTLGIPLEDVLLPKPDSRDSPDSGPTVASRTTMIVGGLLAQAAGRLRQQWRDGEAQSVEERYVQPKEIVWDEETFHGDAYPAYSWGVVAVEVEVEKSTYRPMLRGCWAAYDAGTTIDRLMAEGQADGGIAQGIAYGYLENMEIRDGRLRQKNLTDYIIPTAADVCPTTTVFVENPYDLGPFGAKGLGELTLVGGAPAVVAAIENAIGRPLHRIPATPESLWELIRHGND